MRGQKCEDERPCPQGLSGKELIDGSTDWRPLHLLSVYKDVESRDDRCAAAILLPTGVGESGSGIKVSIEGGCTLLVTIT